MLPFVRPSLFLVTMVAWLWLPLPRALAQQPADAPRVHELRFDWTRDSIISGSAAVLWISSEALFKGDLAPAHCRWCDRAPDGTDRLNRLDRWGRGLAGSTESSRERAGTWSNIIGFGVLPAGVIGMQLAVGRASDSPHRYFAQDTAIILESALLATLANQTVKFIAGRERPFVHVLPEDQKGLTEQPSDNNLSFYSGHTSLAFSLVVSAGTVAALRGYDHQAWIWAVGLPVATSVGLLRMGADKHYLTDVATGAVLGAAFGVAVPLLLHGRTDGGAPASASRPSSSGVRATPMVSARMAGFSGTF
ncbi:phosphatase PAP2 family protein [Myxococcus stipitatus]|uniref:phosphatase PAP2 family protein n=1 Tax=Myxococcus stipitatus TaxID=83455 RepID=UPI001F316E99|nr:phosphatase PAP2 family protein [Myxococcus stipitatus]MCE9666803.1 phosphatase PAP2 family protein [Myxococcus stipitatus]